MKIKSPESEIEFQKMWQLNHQVFAAELHQHQTSPNNLLIDKFHHKNIYRIAVDRNGEVVGMICAHWEEPFSAVGHFGAPLAARIVPGKTAEIRLFAIISKFRKSGLSIRLAAAMIEELAKNEELEYLVISGISEQKEFYEHIGLETVSEPIVDGNTTLYPMFGRIRDIMTSNQVFRRYHYDERID